MDQLLALLSSDVVLMPMAAARRPPKPNLIHGPTGSPARSCVVSESSCHRTCAHRVDQRCVRRRESLSDGQPHSVLTMDATPATRAIYIVPIPRSSALPPAALAVVQPFRAHGHRGRPDSTLCSRRIASASRGRFCSGSCFRSFARQQVGCTLQRVNPRPSMSRLRIARASVDPVLRRSACSRSSVSVSRPLHEAGAQISSVSRRPISHRF